MKEENNNENFKTVSGGSINFTSLPQDLNGDSYLKDNYDLLSGSYPSSVYDVVLMVDSKNRIDKNLLDALFVDSSKKEINFNEIVGKELKVISNDNYYSKINENVFAKKEPSKEMYDKGITLKIVGIVRGKKDNVLASIMDVISESMG